MPRYEDLTGKKFGKLTVLEVTQEKTKDGRRIWKCLCDCGNIKYTSCQNLKRGHCTSCGCKNKQQIAALGRSRGYDLKGQQFDKLIVIEKAKEKLSYSNSIAWICKCQCGNIITTTSSALMSGNTKSCGYCRKSEGEEQIALLLDKWHIDFIRESQVANLKSNNNRLLRFDFYLPKQNIYIEFDGEQHYTINRYSSKEQFERDCKKNEYCLNNNILLYRIPYNEKNNIKNWKSLNDVLQDKFLVKQINHYNINYYD